MKYVIILIIYINVSFAFQKSETISVDAVVSDGLKLSQFADNSEMIVLEPVEGQEFDAIHGIIIADDYVFISTTLRIENTDKSRILQYNRKGKFVRQIGIDFQGWINLIHEPVLKRVGASNGKTIDFYDYQGNKKQEITTSFTKSLIQFKDYFWGVDYTFSSNQVKYTLKRVDLYGSEARPFFSFYDNSQGYIGTNVRLSVVDNHLYFWDNFADRLYEVKNSGVKQYVNIKLSKELKSRTYTHVVGNWVVLPLLDQTKGRGLVKLINLKTDQSYGWYEQRSGKDKPVLGVYDDISGGGVLNVFDNGSVYGDVQNKIVFKSKTSAIPQSIRSSYVEDSPVLFVVTLKQ